MQKLKIFWVNNHRFLLLFISSLLGIFALYRIQFYYNFPWWVFMFIAVVICWFPYALLSFKEYQQELDGLDQIQLDMQHLIDPNTMYERMGTDTLSLQVGASLLQIADPEQGGLLLGKLAGLRTTLTDELGYVLTNFRIMDSNNLEPYQYMFSVRYSSVAKGFVYPERLMVLATDYDKLDEILPDTAIVGVDPISNAPVYWLNHSDVKPEWQLKTSEATEIIIEHIKQTTIRYANDIISRMDVLKLMELMRQSDAWLVDYLVPDLVSHMNMRRILANLIREEVSIKDIQFIFEQLSDYALYCENTDELTQCIRNALGLQICKNLLGNNETLLAVKLSTQWENCLEEAYQYSKALGGTFNLTHDYEVALVESTDVCLRSIQQQHYGRVPVILCSPRIRLPLYQLLDRHLPMITVLSYSELIPDVKMQAVDSINMPEGA